MIPQNPFQGVPIRPIASPVSAPAAPGNAGGTFAQDIADLSGLSRTAAAVMDMMAKESKKKFEEDFSVGKADALSNPYLLSDIQVGVEAQKGGDQKTKDTRAILENLRKQGKISGPDTPGYYAGIEVSLGIRAGRNKGDALNAFIMERVNAFDPESDEAPTPPTFDDLQAEFESKYKDKDNLPSGYYAADGFANAYGKDIEVAQNGYFSAVKAYEERRGKAQTIRRNVDVLVQNSLDGVDSALMGKQLMNDLDNSVKMGHVAPADRRKVLHDILRVAASTSTIPHNPRGARNAQNALDLIDAAKEWVIPATKKTLIEDDPEFFETIEEEWKRKRDADVDGSARLKEREIAALRLDWVTTLHSNIAAAENQSFPVDSALEATLEQLKSKMGDSPLYGTLSLALRDAATASKASLDTSDERAVAKWEASIARDPKWALDLLNIRRPDGVGASDWSRLMKKAQEASGIGTAEGNNSRANFISKLDSRIKAEASFLPADAEGAEDLRVQLESVLSEASAKWMQLSAMTVTGQANATLDLEGGQAAIDAEANKKIKDLLEPLRTFHDTNLSAYYQAQEKGDLFAGLASIRNLESRRLISIPKAAEMRKVLRSEASGLPVLQSREWGMFLNEVDAAVQGPTQEQTALSIAAAAERRDEEDRDLRVQIKEWRKQGFSTDEIMESMLTPYVNERRKKLVGEDLFHSPDKEAINAEISAGGTLQTFVEKTNEASAFFQRSNSLLLTPLENEEKIDVPKVSKELFSPSFSGDELHRILDDVHNGGRWYLPTNVAKTGGLWSALELAEDIATGRKYAEASDKDAMTISLLGLVPGKLDYRAVTKGSVDVPWGPLRPIFTDPQPGVAGTIALKPGMVNPFRDILFRSTEEITAANSNGELKPLMRALGLPTTEQAATNFIDAQTKLLRASWGAN